MFLDESQETLEHEETLGGRILTAREAEGLTSGQLANRIGVKNETLGAWETDRSEPRPNQLVTISGVLNVSPSWLLTGAGESPSEGLSEKDMLQIRAAVARLRDKISAAADDLEQIEKQLGSYPGSS